MRVWRVPAFVLIGTAFIVAGAAGASVHATDHYLQGLQLARDGRIEDAIVEMRSAAELDSNAVEIHIELSRLFLQSHRPAEAVAPARRATSLDPMNSEGHWLLGQSLLEQSQVDAALPPLRRALELDPGRPAYVTSLLIALDLSGKTEEALRLLRPEEGGIDPGTPYLLLRRGELEEKAGRVRDALLDYLQTMRVAPGYPDAPARLAAACRRLAPSDSTAEACSLALQIDPKQSGIRRTLVQILIELGKEEEAVPHLETLYAEDSLDAPVIMQLGVIRLRHAEPLKAIPLIRTAIGIDPTIPDARDWLWRALNGADSVEAALRVAGEIVAAAPGDRNGHWYRAVSLSRMKDYAGAIAELDAVERLSPGDRGGAMLSAMILAEQGDTGGAKLRLTRLLRSSPDDHEALYRLAQVEQRAGHADSALALFRHLIETDPDNASALNDAGYMCADSGVDLEKALEWTQRAVSLDGKNAAFRDSYGWALFRLGRYQEAIVQLQEAARTASEPEVRIHLAQALRAVGRLEEGRKILQELLVEQPAEDRARQLLQEWDKGGIRSREP